MERKFHNLGEKTSKTKFILLALTLKKSYKGLSILRKVVLVLGISLLLAS